MNTCLEVRPAARMVDILDAQDERASRRLRRFIGCQRAESMAEMQVAGGGGREAGVVHGYGLTLCRKNFIKICRFLLRESGSECVYSLIYDCLLFHEEDTSSNSSLPVPCFMPHVGG